MHRCCLLALLVTLLSVAALAGSLPPPRTVTTTTLSAGPTIDGELDDPCWATAAVLAGWVDSDAGTPAPLAVTGKVCVDTQQLYVAYRCFEPEPAALRAVETRDGEAVSKDECLEVFLASPLTGRGYVQVQVNPNGAKRVTGADGDLAVRAAAKRLEEGWQAEVAIPLRALGIERLAQGVGWEWRFNLNRQRRLQDGTAVDYNWSCLYDRWGDVSRFGKLQVNPGAAVVLNRLNVLTPRWGRGNVVSAQVRAARPCRVQLSCRSGSSAQTTTASLGPGQTRELRARYDLLAPGGSGNRLRLALAVDGKPALTLDRSLQVPAPMTVVMEEPNYRGYLWPDTRQVRGYLELALTPTTRAQARYEVELVVKDTGQRVSARTRREGDQLRFTVPADAVVAASADKRKAGQSWDAELRAKVIEPSGRLVAEERVPLRRFTAAEQAALPAYIDRYQRLIVGGQPFFPLGWYSNRQVTNLEEMKAGGFNCALDYSINHLKLEEIRAYLDAAERLGMKLIYCNNDLYPSYTQGQTKGPWQGSAIVEGIVDTFKDHPALIAWYLNDERPTSMLPELTDYYRRVRDHDPGHPAFIVLCDMDTLPLYYDTTDVMGVDPYPIPHGPVTRVAEWAEISRAGVRGTKPTWLVPQAFGWYQYREPAPWALGGRGRVPTAAELEEGREPTFAEERAMTWLALNHGAKGLIYYCYYDNRVLPHHKEHFAGMSRIAAEVNRMMPVLLSTEQVGRKPFTCADPNIDLGVWRYQGRWYVAAVNTTNETRRAVLRGPFGGRVEALFEEGRTLTVKRQVLQDTFEPLQVHVYSAAIAG